ncbi:MAG: NAD(P)-dependent dehydrogenase (short-subunit alcohol dehydrogenase family) [Rhodothermales bacterium]|jgi:NAD(P)-dependent dehydrogenase (short-subunit alcohol dehydrogenase family)
MTGTVLITGGGLGRHTALAFADAGHRIAICGRTAEDLDEVVRGIKDVGGQAMRGVLDVRDLAAMVQFIEDVENELGPIDVLVNNAGFSH